LIAVGAPVGEVLGSDGFGGELSGEDFLDGREGVEPGQDFGAVLAVEEPMVELLAEVEGKSGDFTGKSFHRILNLRFTIYETRRLSTSMVIWESHVGVRDTPIMAV